MRIRIQQTLCKTVEERHAAKMAMPLIVVPHVFGGLPKKPSLSAKIEQSLYWQSARSRRDVGLESLADISGTAKPRPLYPRTCCKTI